MPGLLEKLAGGDRRSIGGSNKVVADVLRNPSLLPGVFAGLFEGDPLIRMRVADVVEKITARIRELLSLTLQEGIATEGRRD